MRSAPQYTAYALFKYHLNNIVNMIVAAEDDLDEHASPSVLTGIKEKLIVTDLINELDYSSYLLRFLLKYNIWQSIQASLHRTCQKCIGCILSSSILSS